MRQWNGSAFVQIMACSLLGTKPLSKPMLDYCQLDSWEQISVKFELEFYHFHSRKCTRNCRLPRWRPLCPGGRRVNIAVMSVVSDSMDGLLCVISDQGKNACQHEAISRIMIDFLLPTKSIIRKTGALRIVLLYINAIQSMHWKPRVDMTPILSSSMTTKLASWQLPVSNVEVHKRMLQIALYTPVYICNVLEWHLVFMHKPDKENILCWYSIDYFCPSSHLKVGYLWISSTCPL